MRFLASTRLLGDLPEQVLCAIAPHFQPRAVPRGEVLFRTGDPARAVRLLAEGRVKVFGEDAGKRVALRLMWPGDLFGGAGGWGEQVYPATGVALADAVLLELESDAFHRLTALHPEVALALIQELAARLRDAEARIRDLHCRPAEQRIARCLLRLARRTGSAHLWPVTREDLAELSATTAGTASRALRAWDRLGIVKSGRGRVTILHVAALEALAG